MKMGSDANLASNGALNGPGRAARRAAAALAQHSEKETLCALNKSAWARGAWGARGVVAGVPVGEQLLREELGILHLQPEPLIHSLTRKQISSVQRWLPK